VEHTWIASLEYRITYQAHLLLFGNNPGISMGWLGNLSFSTEHLAGCGSALSGVIGALFLSLIIFEGYLFARQRCKDQVFGGCLPCILDAVTWRTAEQHLASTRPGRHSISVLDTHENFTVSAGQCLKKLQVQVN
jgi:hypothetical protein